MRKIDLAGHRFGRLVAVRQAPKREGNPHLRWLVRCDCGTEKAVDGAHLRYGRIVSCGCYNAEIIRGPEAIKHLRKIAGDSTRTHGRSKSPVYAVWKTMRDRCRNHKSKNWMDYGGRGIRVCDRWDRFENFLADMGERPEGLTLERNNVNGDYCPENCRWATWSDQAKNRRAA